MVQYHLKELFSLEIKSREAGTLANNKHLLLLQGFVRATVADYH